MSSKYHQGYFTPKNSDKWINSKSRTPITYRSSWELKFFNWADSTEAVLEVGSESHPIRYINPVKKKICVYFPDIYVKIKDKSGKITTYLIEIKPEKETKKPINTPKKKAATLMYERFLYIQNLSKWLEAQKVCRSKGWIFKLITEHELFNIT